MLPKLAGAELGIEKLLDQRGFCLLLRNVAGMPSDKSLLEEVHYDALEREALDALRAPFGADLVARHAPDLLGIRLEKRQVKLLAKPVDDEIFQGFLFALWHQRRAQITESATEGAGKAQISEGCRGQAAGIVEEAAQKIDAALALANQHNQIFRLRIVRPGRRGKLALLPLIAQLSRFINASPTAGGNRHQFQPPAHHPVRFRKEAMAADVHAVALVADGARDTADLLASLDHNRLDCRIALQFDGGCQSLRACSDDDCRAVFHAGNRSLPAK